MGSRQAVFTRPLDRQGALLMRSSWQWVHRLSEWHHRLSSGLISRLRTRRMDADRNAVAGIVFIRASLPIRRNSKRPKSKEARAIGLPKVLTPSCFSLTCGAMRRTRAGQGRAMQQ
jgi:hypothetical protein